ncbi:MAG TPA: IS66 family transposase [Chitinophagaceae bacterium]|nr:IS66 family transposase [Chitinophagaceae bacterium]
MTKREKKTDVSHLDSAEKTVLIHLLQEKINLLEDKYLRLEKRYKILEDRLAKNSTNSHKPPSSDTKKGKNKNTTKKTQSLKPKSDKKPGGQIGHAGSHLEMSAQPDELVYLPVDQCAHCQKSLKNARTKIDARQVFEIPEPKIWVTEYQAEQKYCVGCGYTTMACFPEGVTHKTQYGPRIRSLMVYMNQYQLLPFERASEFFEVIYHHRVSAGTIVNAVNALSNRLVDVEAAIKQLLIESDVLHADETSVNIGGNRYWVHTVGTEQLTHYGVHQKRGREATEAIGILPKFRGTMIHDHWKSYFGYEESEHGLCNAHHLRELKFLHEQQGFRWAKRMTDLLISIKEVKAERVKANQCFSLPERLAYEAQYDGVLLAARREQARKGTIESHHLLRRLRDWKNNVLLFMHRMEVPFTNNLSERDLRMHKVKQKISGCFRGKDGSQHFCRVRSVIGTAKKNGYNIFSVLQTAFQRILCIEDIVAYIRA